MLLRLLLAPIFVFRFAPKTSFDLQNFARKYARRESKRVEWSGVREKESAACPLNEVRNHSFNYERHSNGATAAAPSTDNSWRKSMMKKERDR